MEREGSRSTQMSKAMDMYLKGATAAAAAEACNVPKSALYKMLKFANKIRPLSKAFEPKTEDLPSEEEVWKAAARIRRSWTDEERSKRWVANARNDRRLERMYAALRRAYRPGEAA